MHGCYKIARRTEGRLAGQLGSDGEEEGEDEQIQLDLVPTTSIPDTVTDSLMKAAVRNNTRATQSGNMTEDRLASEHSRSTITNIRISNRHDYQREH